MSGANKILTILAAVVLMLFAVPAFSPNTQAQSGAINYSGLAGYVVTGASGTIDMVRGSWIVPAVNCTATPNSVLNMSSILDGINGVGDMLEIGTYSNCVSGVAEYGAFLQVYPTLNGTIKMTIPTTIHPGDAIEAQGRWDPIPKQGRACNGGGGRGDSLGPAKKPTCIEGWHFSLDDYTTGASHLDFVYDTPAGFSASCSSGAFVLTSNGKTLSSYTSVLSGWDNTGKGVGGLGALKNSDDLGPFTSNTPFGVYGGISGFTLAQLSMAGATAGPVSKDQTSFAITP